MKCYSLNLFRDSQTCSKSLGVKNRYIFDNEYKKDKLIRINLDKTYITPLVFDLSLFLFVNYAQNVTIICS